MSVNWGGGGSGSVGAISGRKPNLHIPIQMPTLRIQDWTFAQNTPRRAFPRIFNNLRFSLLSIFNDRELVVQSRIGGFNRDSFFNRDCFFQVVALAEIVLFSFRKIVPNIDT